MSKRSVRKSRRAKEKVQWDLFAYGKSGVVRLSPTKYKKFKWDVHYRDGRCINPNCMSATMGPPFNELTIHHHIRRSQGGGDTFDNCVTLCVSCHDLIHDHHTDDDFVESYLNNLYPQRNAG